MHLLKFIAGILMIVIIYNVVFAGGLTLHQIGDSSAQVMQEAAESEVGQVIIERICSWIAEFVAIIRDAFIGTSASTTVAPTTADAGRLLHSVYACVRIPFPCA